MTHLYLDQALTAHRRPAGAMPNWRIGVYALVERHGKILVVDQIVGAKSLLALPGGGVELEREETILEGSVREVYEETGYHFQPNPESLTLIRDYFMRSPSGRHYHAVAFLVRGSVSDLPDLAWCKDDAEIISASWVDPRELRQRDIRRLHWDALTRLGYVGRS